MTRDGNEWSVERSRIADVLKVIETKKEQLLLNTTSLKEDIIDLRKKFWDDVTVNFDEVDDAVETYASIKQQSELLSERERSHGHYHKNKQLLERMEKSPYFGRIDFEEEGEGEEQIYIGVSSLMDEKEEYFLVYDWRAPVSSMYYDFEPGPAHYLTPSGTVKGEIELKRQFVIENSQLAGMFNTGITIGDSLLQKVLGDRASSQMKSIVATIQKEQNAIIRNESSRLLLVQGVAGSGKTSAAMQRVAYLLYRYRKQIGADQILLFSPNQMFSSYVAAVLPELGEEPMQQSTFQEYVSKRLDSEFTLQTPFEQLEASLATKASGAGPYNQETVDFKSSVYYKEMIDHYLTQLSTNGMKFRNLKFRGEVVITAEEIKEYFYQLDPSMKMANRVDLVKDWLFSELKRIEKEEQAKDWAEEEAGLLSKEEYHQAFQQLERGHNFDEETFDDFEKEEWLLRNWVVKRRIDSLRRKVADYQFIHIRKVYGGMFHDSYSIQNQKLPKSWEIICNRTLRNLQQRYLPVEDQTPYLYLKDQLEGKKVNTSIRYVFMDEAQDYSIFQFLYIKELFPHAQFTLLGDKHQAIYSHNHGQKTILDEQVHEGKATKMELSRSYRSTKPIVDFTKCLLKDGAEIEAFNRDGQLPRVWKTERNTEAKKAIIDVVRSRQKEGHKTIAILCYSLEESKLAYELVGEELDAALIYKETQSFQEGVLILPVYLAKGIEFDGVVVYNAANPGYQFEGGHLMLYTACTRAMHELDIFIHNNCPILSGIPVELYMKKETAAL
ncbi:RNA polymerase recycling motor HelD [Halobacillus naozhouensis]|uniref:RNA polymerase recycling motor HelD n=1 Tax=Halobacillus naozhouensis TaxID=554880 RepID=A0ABY8J1D6_9BACI|nr:RNA polymerase recycling motor HelD [Halobacillus naozhouensis]WFT74585.1 RNA polymerase recycling motor HelD [Halobacillus naozhouensis]